MNSADLVTGLKEERDRHVIGYPGPRRDVAELLDNALDRIEALEARLAEAIEALRQHRANTVPVMRALMATGSRADLILADDVHRADDAARRLVEKENGRAN